MKRRGKSLEAARPKSAPLSTPPADVLGDAGLSGSAWENLLQRSLSPQEAESILSAAWSGDLGGQKQLLNSMLDTWPMLATTLRTVQQAMIAAPFETVPWREDESDVTESAAEKAALVEAAFTGMQPRKARELDRDGLLRGFGTGELGGHQVFEVHWEWRMWRGRRVILPRCVTRVGTQHYGYEGGGHDLKFREKSGAPFGEWPEHKFIVHVAPAHEAHPAQAGRWRVLTKFWAGITYGWEWMMTATNKFGTPFRTATYKREHANVKSTLLAMMANLGTAGYGVFPEGVKLDFLTTPQGTGDMPQERLMKLADMAAELVMLGEVQSSGREGRTGLSSGEVQGNVRRDALQGYCNAAVTSLNQLARMVVAVNYGPQAGEIPGFRAEIPEPEDSKANAERDSVLTQAGVPITLSQLQSRHDLDAPAEGELVLMGGKIVKWADKAVPGMVKPGASLTAAKATVEGQKLEDVLERLIINAVIAGAADAKVEMENGEE